jgi:hypothetical protein
MGGSGNSGLVVPGPHVAHLNPPLENFPDGHAPQSLSFLLPNSGENFPGSHNVHAVAAAWSPYFPGPQRLQLDRLERPGTRPSVPKGQGVGAHEPLGQ